MVDAKTTGWIYKTEAIHPHTVPNKFSRFKNMDVCMPDSECH